MTMPLIPVEFTPVPARSNLRAVLQWIKEHAPSLRKRQVVPTLEDELERLALASPHLLTDLGFCEDRGTGDPAQTIWRRGTLRVTISHAKTAVLIDVAP